MHKMDLNKVNSNCGNVRQKSITNNSIIPKNKDICDDIMFLLFLGKKYIPLY